MREKMPTKTALVQTVQYSSEGLQNFEAEIGGKSDAKVLLDYPTVYVITMKDVHKGYKVYVGETNAILKRTEQHLKGDTKVQKSNSDFWRQFSQSPDTKMYVVGHTLFNKSLTLDVENRLMQFLPSNDAVESARASRIVLENSRTNEQGDYFTKEYFDEVFSQIWAKLNRLDRQLFPLERILRDSALFKASPFHALTKEQSDAKFEIIEAVISQTKEKSDTKKNQRRCW